MYGRYCSRDRDGCGESSVARTTCCDRRLDGSAQQKYRVSGGECSCLAFAFCPAWSDLSVTCCAPRVALGVIDSEQLRDQEIAGSRRFLIRASTTRETRVSSFHLGQGRDTKGVRQNKYDFPYSFSEPLADV